MAAPQFFRLTDFSGGLNLDQHPVLLQDNQAVDILNFSLTRQGSLVSRKGYSLYTSAVLPDDIVQIGRHEDLATSSTTVLVHLADGTIQAVDDTTATELATGFGSVKGSFVAAQDATIYANGQARPVLYDGTEMVELGIDAPDSLTATAVAGGSLSEADYVYAVSFYDSVNGIESNTFSASAVTVSGTDLSVELTLPTSADSRVDTIRIYRTAPDGSVLQYLDEVAEGTATYTDDGSKSLNPFFGTPNGQYLPAPDLENIAYLGGWYFGSIGRNLYWSLPLDPHHWPPLNVTEVPFLGNDEIVALVAHQDTLLVFGRQNILVVTGQGPDWSITRLDTEVGAASRDAAIELGGQVVFLSHDGLRTFPGLSPVAPALTRTLATLTPLERSQAILAHVPDDQELWLCVDGRTYVVYLPNQAVTRYNFDPVAVLSGGIDGESNPLMALDNGGTLALYGGTTDNGKDITLFWSSKTFQLPNPERVKYLRRLGGYATSGEAIEVTFYPMGGSPYHTTLVSGGEANEIEWDEFEWDVGIWTHEGVEYKVAPLPAHTLQGHAFRLVLSASTDQRTEISPPLTILYRESNRLLGE